jgi:ABC-2 type transport system permease protein
MYKLWATIVKDTRILVRDKVGLIFMFIMPIILVVVVTAIQNSAFEAVNANKVPMLICIRDTGGTASAFAGAIEGIGMFRLTRVPAGTSDSALSERVHGKEAMIAVVISGDFSRRLNAGAALIAGKALNSFGLQGDTAAPGSAGTPGLSDARTAPATPDPVTIYYHPVLQESFRRSVKGAVGGAMQLLESKLVLQAVYRSINDKPMPDSMASALLTGHRDEIKEISVSRDGVRSIPNATQHNVPAWTIFAMFFVVLSLGGSVVREKINGSFVRLKTLPTPYVIALLSKQITYLCVTMLQTVVIFAIGIWLFPCLDLPALHLPHDGAALFMVTLICGWCAVSYAICVGVFAKTQEQANGFGAISILILAVIGGLMVPGFVMPDGMRTLMNASPLHWCLEAYYGLFLEGGKLSDVWVNIIPLIAITIGIQALTLWGLKRKQLI